MKIVSATDLI